MNKNSLSTNEELYTGSSSPSVLIGKYKAGLPGGSAIWQTNTARSTGARLILQNDGNFVMYTPKNEQVWCTDTRSDEVSWRMRLTLTNSGHLELRRDGEIIWTSEKSVGVKK
ncbi:hypothetical protein CRUP_022355 [Coryphaenoides rupestris]|nr:hypothetical protein CRUP_022355 [Coryphaenoides rupestris]